jgi:hypothetical protein
VHDSDGHFFGLENFILKTMMFRDVMTILNERKHLKMVIRSIGSSEPMQNDQTYFFSDIFLNLYNIIKLQFKTIKHYKPL